MKVINSILNNARDREKIDPNLLPTHEILLGFRGGSAHVDCNILEEKGGLSLIQYEDIEVDGSFQIQWVDSAQLHPLK